MFDTKTAPYAATVLRVALGVMFLSHAALKYFVFTLPGSIGFFESVGLPGFFAPLTIIAETIGGIALILGVYSRYVSLALLPPLVGSIVFVHGKNGWQFAAEGGGWEYSAFLIAASVAQILLGDGALSVRSLIKK